MLTGLPGIHSLSAAFYATARLTCVLCRKYQHRYTLTEPIASHCIGTYGLASHCPGQLQGRAGANTSAPSTTNHRANHLSATSRSARVGSPVTSRATRMPATASKLPAAQGVRMIAQVLAIHSRRMGGRSRAATACFSQAKPGRDLL